MSEEALQIAEEISKKQERKGKVNPIKCTVSKNNKERQRPSSVNNAKKQEENNRRGKTRDLFKKIGDIKGTFHSNMGTIKGLIEAEEMKKRCQKGTEELYKKRS